jgi:predicted dehydrogenase/threonine dehydrogenase-like Zn-dependent dehydrogenase
MRQILAGARGALIARMPRPTVETRSVLVRVRYSFVSTGTEMAALPVPPMPSPRGWHSARAGLRWTVRNLAWAARGPRRATARARVHLSELRARLAASRDSATGPDESRGGDRADRGAGLGYSCAGIVEEVGELVTDISVGQAVACAGAGRANHADYVVVPRNLVELVPPGVSLEAAATTTVGTVALQGVRRAEPRIGDRILVLGLGLLGQLSVLVLRQCGCRVLGFDPDPARVELGRRMGLDIACADPEDLAVAIRALTAGHGVDATIITASSKSDEIINRAMEHTRRKGVVVVVGDVGLRVERAHFYRKEIDLRISTSYGPGRYDESYEDGGQDYPYAHVRWTLNRNMQAYLELLGRPGFDISPLIENRSSVDEAPEAYRALGAASPRPLSALFSYPEPPEEDRAAFALPRMDIRVTRPRGGPIRFALVGVGAFAGSTLVPALEGRPDLFSFVGVVSRDTARGGNFARAHGVPFLATNLEAAIEDPRVDLVVIATRHAEHAGQVVKALKAGKHVFVEKPLAITWEQLAEVEECYRALSDPPALVVGFNRRFAPSVSLLGERISRRLGPLMISCRVNAGFIAADHWIQGEQGGGRNIGEACHFYDLFRRLVGHPVESVDARSIVPGSAAVLRSDNFGATLRYADGSLASLFYTASGPGTGLGKEMVEVFCDGRAYCLDDFKALRLAGTDAPLWASATADKGHAEEFGQLGLHLLGKAPPPMSVAEILESSAVALQVEDLILERTLTSVP